MSAYTLNIPEDLLREAEKLAKANNASLNELLLAAIADRIGVERTQKVFRELAKSADAKSMEQILARVPDLPPVAGDEIKH